MSDDRYSWDELIRRANLHDRPKPPPPAPPRPAPSPVPPPPPEWVHQARMAEWDRAMEEVRAVHRQLAGFSALWLAMPKLDRPVEGSGFPANSFEAESEEWKLRCRLAGPPPPARLSPEVKAFLARVDRERAERLRGSGDCE